MSHSFKLHNSEICFQISSTSNQQHFDHNRPTASSSVGGVMTTPSDQRLSGCKRSHNNSKSELIMDHQEGIKMKKRMKHREIEKTRRKDMSKLCSSLSSLLPPPLIKRRQSMPESMEQAVSYIKHLQQNIKGLETKRDELKKACGHRSDHSCFITNKNTKKERLLVGCSHNPVSVTVSSSPGGIDVLIKKEKGFLMSTVIEALIQEGLDVISWNFTKLNDQLIHSIQSEVAFLSFFI
ncbi:putative transcription factor bHLH family [Helianthus debilis subsp. tardiflorus]